MNLQFKSSILASAVSAVAALLHLAPGTANANNAPTAVVDPVVHVVQTNEITGENQVIEYRYGEDPVTRDIAADAVSGGGELLGTSFGQYVVVDGIAYRGDRIVLGCYDMKDVTYSNFAEVGYGIGCGGRLYQLHQAWNVDYMVEMLPLLSGLRIDDIDVDERGDVWAIAYDASHDSYLYRLSDNEWQRMYSAPGNWAEPRAVTVGAGRVYMIVHKNIMGAPRPFSYLVELVDDNDADLVLMTEVFEAEVDGWGNIWTRTYGGDSDGPRDVLKHYNPHSQDTLVLLKSGVKSLGAAADVID